MSTRVLVLFVSFFAACSPRPSVAPHTPDAGVAFPELHAECSAENFTGCVMPCSKGVGDACFTVAARMFQAENYSVAGTFAEKACAAGDACGCGLQGALLHGGLGCEKKPVAGLQLMTRSCEGGCGPGCVAMGHLYRDGDTVEKDAEKAFAYYDRGCTLGSDTSCAHAGHALATGAGVRKDRDRGLQMLADACKGGLEWACKMRTEIENKKDEGQTTQLY